MVRPDVVQAKILTAHQRLHDAAEFFADKSILEKESRRQRDLAMFYLFLAIQECIDIAAHWVADAGWGAPSRAAGAFDTLAQHDVIDVEHAQLLRAAVGLRNRIGHGYTSIDTARVLDELDTGVSALRRFLSLATDAADSE